MYIQDPSFFLGSAVGLVMFCLHGEIPSMRGFGLTLGVVPWSMMFTCMQVIPLFVSSAVSSDSSIVWTCICQSRRKGLTSLGGSKLLSVFLFRSKYLDPV
jgi:hypothetical protein